MEVSLSMGILSLPSRWLSLFTSRFLRYKLVCALCRPSIQSPRLWCRSNLFPHQRVSPWRKPVILLRRLSTTLPLANSIALGVWDHSTHRLWLRLTVNHRLFILLWLTLLSRTRRACISSRDPAPTNLCAMSTRCYTPHLRHHWSSIIFLFLLPRCTISPSGDGTTFELVLYLILSFTTACTLNIIKLFPMDSLKDTTRLRNGEVTLRPTTVMATTSKL